MIALAGIGIFALGVAGFVMAVWGAEMASHHNDNGIKVLLIGIVTIALATTGAHHIYKKKAVFDAYLDHQVVLRYDLMDLGE